MAFSCSDSFPKLKECLCSWGVTLIPHRQQNAILIAAHVIGNYRSHRAASPAESGQTPNRNHTLEHRVPILSCCAVLLWLVKQFTRLRKNGCISRVHEAMRVCKLSISLLHLYIVSWLHHCQDSYCHRLDGSLLGLHGPESSVIRIHLSGKWGSVHPGRYRGNKSD